MFSLIFGFISIISSVFLYTGVIKNMIHIILLIFLSIIFGIIGIMINNREVEKKGKVSEVGETLCVLGIATSIAGIIFRIIIAMIFISVFKSLFPI